MAGVKSLRKIQLGLETTPGTPVAATAVLRGMGAIKDAREQKQIGEDIGFLCPVDRSIVPKLLAELDLKEVEATFEQLPYPCAAGIKNVVTGSADGAGSGKIYTYTAPTTTQNAIKTYTIQGGDNQEAERMEYAFCEEIKLSGKQGEAVKMASKWKGRQVALNAFTGSLVPPTVEEILFSKGKLYIDAVSGTIGTTIQSNSLIGMDITIKTGFVPVFSADGQLYFSTIVQTGFNVEGELTFLHDAVGAARKVDWRAETPRLIRLLFEGSNLVTAGTAYSKKTLKIDMAAKFHPVDPLGEEDGLSILKAKFTAAYNATAAKFFEMVVVNELASLP